MADELELELDYGEEEEEVEAGEGEDGHGEELLQQQQEQQQEQHDEGRRQSDDEGTARMESPSRGDHREVRRAYDDKEGRDDGDRRRYRDEYRDVVDDPSLSVRVLRGATPCLPYPTSTALISPR